MSGELAALFSFACVAIPDGRTLNVSTPEGSAAFLEWGAGVITRYIFAAACTSRLEVQPIVTNKNK